jgi:hypothetical protein
MQAALPVCNAVIVQALQAEQQHSGVRLDCELIKTAAALD